mmetsp:Transcript_20740/g.49023  ORF Transcript_20740/g.49023 Transcript_20740/m.49023 type:complete len:159 (-) Transcript_20740:59-535(-)
MVRSRLAHLSVAVASAASSALAFAPSSSPPQQTTRTSTIAEARTCLQMAPPGGWGIPGAGGTSFRDEEFADNRGRVSRQGRRGYDAYELENRGAFMKRVREEQKGMKQKKKDELLSIAKMAGIKTKKKEGLYGKFDADDFEDEDLLEDDLDLRVTGDD